MNADEHRALRTDLGAYALGQLPYAEVRRMEEHLAGCDACRAEYDELLPVAGALAGLRADGEDAAEVQPSPHLRDRVLGAVRDEERAERSGRRSARWRSAGLVAAGLSAGAVAASAVLAATVGLGGEGPPPAVVPLEAVEVDPRGAGIEAEADLVAHTWGVEVKLRASGFDRGGTYRVVVLGDDGRAHPAGGFVGTGAAPMVCNLNSTVLRDDASGFEVRDARGRVVVTSLFET